MIARFAALLAVAAAAHAAPPGRAPGQPVLARDLILTAGAPGGSLSYRWIAPVQAGLHPPLARAMRAGAERQLAADRRDAAELAKLGGASARVSRQVEWRAAADTPRLLSLWATEWHYAGGAHGNTSFTALLWDKASGRQVALRDMAADPRAAFAALTPAFCRALDEERARRRGAAKLDGDEFNRCPDLAGQVVVPVAAGDAAAIGQLAVKLAPYEAGPYAEGAYEVVLPVSAAFVAALRPAWRPAFQASAR